MHKASVITLSQPESGVNPPQRQEQEDGNENVQNVRAPTNTFGGTS